MREVTVVEISRSDKSDVVGIWLTRQDLADDRCMAGLPGLIESLTKQNLLPAVFRSGTGSLYDSTLALLRHNRALQ